MADTTQTTTTTGDAGAASAAAGAGSAGTTGADTSGQATGTPGGTSGAGAAGADGGSSASSTTWDVGTWDGKPESVHESYRPFYERVSKTYEEKLKERETELAQYRDVLSGIGDDPRLTAAEKKAAELEEKLNLTLKEQESGKLTHAEATKKVEALQAQLDKMTETIAQKEAQAFKDRHKDIVSDPAKRQELVTLLDEGWDEEAAAALVGRSSKVRERAFELVKEHGLSGTGHRLAVKTAISELTTDDISSPAALLTSGARGTVAPVRSSERNVRNLSRDAARTEAARLALVSSKR